MTPRPVRREAFRVRLKPGALEEWVRRHEQVWPDLLAVQGACGFCSMSVYTDDPCLVVVSEVEDADSWERLIATPEHKRWVAAMSDLSESARADHTVARVPLPEVLRLEW